jgi:hypothetical protein
VLQAVGGGGDRRSGGVDVIDQENGPIAPSLGGDREGDFEVGLAIGEGQPMLGRRGFGPLEEVGVVGHPGELTEAAGDQFGLVVAPAGLFGGMERNRDDRQGGQGVGLPQVGQQRAEELGDRRLVFIFQLMHQATQAVVVMAPDEVIVGALAGPIALAILQLGLTAGTEQATMPHRQGPIA